MKLMKNENGYALLLVMMLVLLFTTLGMGLLAMNINASKQFNMKEEQVQARHQAEMGVLHYESLLTEKVSSSSLTMLTCTDIEGILGDSKELAEIQYKVSGKGVDKSSCKPMPDEKKLEINVNSKGTISENTVKEVEATFYVENTGGNGLKSITSPPYPEPPRKKDGKINENQIIIDRDLGGSCNGNSENCNYSIYTIEKFAILDELISQRHTFHFKDNLEVGELKVGGGKEDSIRVDKNLYISGNLDITNHACIAIGGNFIVGQKILNKNKNKTDIYVYGDFFMTKDQKDTYDFDFHVRGTVYQYDSIHKEIKEVNRENFGIKNLTNQTTKNCNVTPYNNPDKFIESPLWKLSDDNIINYN